MIRGMASSGDWQEIEFVPMVKAYPALSKTYGEVSCVAGVQTSGARRRWVRLYPVPFRALDEGQQFAKYQPVRLRARTHSGDRRPETLRPDRDSIRIEGKPIPAGPGWQPRRWLIQDLAADSMCEIQRRQAVDGTSLSMFWPKSVDDLLIEEADVSVEKQRIAEAWASQGSLLDGVGGDERTHQIKELELIPWTFKYRYACSDPGCGGHTQSIIDWEIAATYRGMRHRADWQERLREKWLNQLCAPDRETALIVGNQHQHLNSFLVLGVWWPSRVPEQLSLA